MTKAKATKMMNTLGVTLDGPYKGCDGLTYEGMLDAPHRKLFDTHGTHCVLCAGETKAGFWASVVFELDGAGLIDCTNPDCDICEAET